MSAGQNVTPVSEGPAVVRGRTGALSFYGVEAPSVIIARKARKTVRKSSCAKRSVRAEIRSLPGSSDAISAFDVYVKVISSVVGRAKTYGLAPLVLRLRIADAIPARILARDSSGESDSAANRPIALFTSAVSIQGMNERASAHAF